MILEQNSKGREVKKPGIQEWLVGQWMDWAAPDVAVVEITLQRGRTLHPLIVLAAWLFAITVYLQ